MKNLKQYIIATLCAGFGAACELAQKEMNIDDAWVRYLSDKLCKGLEERIPMITRNGHEEQRYPGCVNYSFAYVEGESLLMALKNVAVSSGSACTSSLSARSQVLNECIRSPAPSSSAFSSFSSQACRNSRKVLTRNGGISKRIKNTSARQAFSYCGKAHDYYN